MTGVTEGGRVRFGSWFQKQQGECMKFMEDRIWREVHMALQCRIASRRQNTGWDQGWIHSLLSPSDLLLPVRLHLLKTSQLSK